jgi:polygalacturonase
LRLYEPKLVGKPLGNSVALLTFAGTLAAQIPGFGDNRKVVEPRYPRLCTILTAQFTSAERSSPPTADDTDRLQNALKQCAGTGLSVLLFSTRSKDAIFSRSLSVEGEGLIVGRATTLCGNDGYSGELLSISGANSSLMGPGTIDRRGDLISGTPRLINSKNVENLTVYSLSLKHAGKEHLYVEGGRNFTAWGVTIATPANTHNTDGIDIHSLAKATVIHSSIEDGDDGVAIKTNSAPATNITVRENRFYGAHCMSIGSGVRQRRIR